jgi:hypothetical protein
MAPIPTHPRAARRGGIGSGRPHRNANTNAGVNRHPSAPRNALRGRGTHRRQGRNDHAPVAAPVRPTLASRMTYGDARDRGGAAPRPRPRPQSAVRLQDRITTDHGASGRSVINQQILHRAHGRNDATARPVVHENNDYDNDIVASGPQTNANPQASALFAGFQSNNALHPLAPRPPSTPSPAPVPIRMLNRPTPDANAAVKRPVNTYRGKDPIKRLVTNKKLQAILGDKPLPKERKKAVGDRMQLRMGMSKIT